MSYAIDPENFASLDVLYDVYKIPTLDQFVDAHTKRCVSVCLSVIYVFISKVSRM